MKKMIWLCGPMLVAACTSSSNGGGTGTTAAAVSGAPDTHCSGKEIVVVDPNVCKAQTSGNDDAGADAGGGGDGCGGDYGPTMFNSEGDDDDCKYHVKWTSTTSA